MATRKLGGHTLLLRLARGGMAEVYLGRLTGAAGFEKLVAIKRILPELTTDEQLVSLFVAEARLTATISHPNVCHIVELGEQDGEYYIVMEYLEGVALGDLVGELAQGHIDVRLVGTLLMQACEGLHDAHELRDLTGAPLEVVHRDVSPGNLFVTVDGVLKVLDFGVAKATAPWHTRPGALRGKYPYMSPEQIRGERVDRRSDIFALGVVLFESVTGLGLFHRDSDRETREALTSQAIPRASDYREGVPPALDAAITRALSRDPAERFPDARSFGLAIQDALAPGGGPLPLAVIGEEVRRLFGAALEERRALVARAIASLDAGADEPLAAQPATPRPVLKPVTQALTVTVASKRRASRTIVAIGAIAALAIVAVIAYRAGRSTPAAAPAVASAGVTDRDRSPHVDAATAIDAGVPRASSAEPSSRPQRHVAKKAAVEKKEPALGWITIDSRPWATIAIDGRDHGQTPLYRIALPAGVHSVKADCSCGRSRTFSIEVKAGVAAPARRLRW